MLSCRLYSSRSVDGESSDQLSGSYLWFLLIVFARLIDGHCEVSHGLVSVGWRPSPTAVVSA